MAVVERKVGFIDFVLYTKWVTLVLYKITHLTKSFNFKQWLRPFFQLQFEFDMAVVLKPV